jgi:hypothetical protein
MPNDQLARGVLVILAATIAAADHVVVAKLNIEMMCNRICDWRR